MDKQVGPGVRVSEGVISWGNRSSGRVRERYWGDRIFFFLKSVFLHLFIIKLHGNLPEYI